MLPLPEVLLLGLALELLLPELPVPELLLPEVPRPEVLPPEVPRAASARSAATQSSNATPVMPTQREGVELEAEGPVLDELESEDELGLEGLVALGEVVLPVELGEVVLPVEPAPAEPVVPVLGDEALGLALEPALEPLPELPACASTTPLASALAARTASAFRGKCFIRISMSEAARSAPMRLEERKRHATKRTFAINRLRARRRADCRANAALQSEQ